VIKTKGVAGLYRGFGTVVVGTVPIRAVYLSVLEITKARARDACVALDLPPMAHGLADAAGGAVASSCSQILGVPVDVLSQRQMVQGVSVRAGDGTGGTRELIGYRNGAHALRETLRKEGVRGLYRGFGASVMTLVPSSALWWGAYGTYQRAIWAAVPSHMGGEYATSGESESENGQNGQNVHPPRRVRVPAESTVIGVQIASGVCAGMTSGFLTTPLDIVKTRLQVLSGQPGGEAHTFGGTARALYAEHGAAGFLRGVRPRMTSVSIWGTTMVTAYEFLKRLASVDDRQE
jgi:solute carrier family 25 protein 44